MKRSMGTAAVTSVRVNGTRVADVGSLLRDGDSALACDGDLSTGRRYFESAYRAAERIGDFAAMAEAALGMGGLWVHEHRTATHSTLLEERLYRALGTVDPGSALWLRLRARLAGEADYRAGEPYRILAVLDEARVLDDPVALTDALSIAHHCLLGPEHGTLRQALAAELIRESHRTGRRSDLLMGLLWQTVDMFLAADPHAGRRLRELRELLARENHLAVGFVVAAIEVMLTIRAGNLDRAEALAKECAERGTAAGDVDATGWYGSQLVAIRWYQGRIGEALPELTDLVHSPTLSAIDYSSLAALAVAAATTGDRPTAASALARISGRDLADLPHSSTWLVTLNGIVEAAHLLGDAPLSARAYELLRPHADLPMVGSLGIACFGSVHHALGVASLTLGEFDRAVAHFRAAIRRNLALAHWPAVVASRQRLAEAYTSRAGSGDAAEAERERAAAAQEASVVGIALPGAGTDATGTAATGTAATCVREGGSWRVTLGHRRILVGHRIGMLHLAVLLANPGREIDAAELAAGLSVLDAPVDGSSQPVLDRVAIEEYRGRLARLREEMDDPDAERAARAGAERDWLTSELAAAAGLGGRTRAFSTNRERARIAVGKAIRRAVTHVTRADPVIGEHLARAVRTGNRCSYWPV